MPRTARLPVVMTAYERQVLARLAEYEGLSAAAVIRGLIRREARRLGLWPPARLAARTGQEVCHRG